MCSVKERPVRTIAAVLALKNGIAAFKWRLSEIAQPDVDLLPVRDELSVHSTDRNVNLKGPNKAERLRQVFPEGYVYAGDSRTDFPVWQGAKAAVLVAASRSLGDAVQAAGIPIERVFDDRPSRSA